MSRYDRQKYRDVNPTDINPDDHPITQLKFDGIWCGVEVDQTKRLRYYSRNGELKHDEYTKCDIPPGFYVGEYMYGSQWSKQEDRSGKLFLFDITELKGLGLTSETYLTRYTRLQELKRAGRLPENWQIIANYPTLQINSIWTNLVENGKFEGVVFRHPFDKWHIDVLRAKLSLTEDLRIIDYEEGQGKNKGKLGALVAVDITGCTHSVGGGLSDSLRSQIWKAKEYYRGKIFICEYKKKFESGKLRHPNFIGWHPDKTKL